MPADNPTIEFYGHLDKAFKFFNERLFDGELPKVMFELTNKKNVGGFFKAKAWQAVDGTFVHTIAVNPQFIVRSTPVEIYDILVHEQAHLWQHLYGNEGRGNYHNKEWAEKMESIGLMPSDTGRPGGKKTGQSMSDYPIPGGLFDQACIDFILEGNYVSFVDATVDEAEVLKFRNQLMTECVKKGESLAEHYNNFLQGKSFKTEEECKHIDPEELEDIVSSPPTSTFSLGDIDDDDDELFVVYGADDEYDLDDESSHSFCLNGTDIEDIDDEEGALIEDGVIAEMERQMALLVNSPMQAVANVIINDESKESSSNKNKVTYQCGECGCKVWGKPNLSILCMDCDEPYTPIQSNSD